MGQYISPPLETYLKTLVPMMPSQRLPFFNRMDNLCELSGIKMPNLLAVEVEKVFGFEMVKIIEGFADYSPPRLKEILYPAIGNVIPRPLQLEFIRLFSRVCQTCPVICLTVSDPSELPDPPTGCEFAELRYVDLTGFIITLYQWDGVAWDDKATVSGLFTAGEIEDVNYGFKDAWTATLNGNAVSGAGTYNFAPAVASLDVVFINGSCSYAMEPAVAFPSEPLMFTYFMDRDIATDDDVDVTLQFSAIGQTGYIDWGDGSPLEEFTTGGLTSVTVPHTFANSGLSSIKVYGANPELLITANIISGLASTNGGTSLVFDASTTGLLSTSIEGCSLEQLPTGMPLAMQSISIQPCQIATADLTSFTELQSVLISSSPLLTSVNIVGLASLQNCGFTNNPLLTSVDITGCVFLNSVTIYIDALDENAQYTILGILDANGVTDGYFDSTGQVPPAPLIPAHPSITSLQAKGWSLSFDT